MDLRKPIGYLFTLLGLILIVWGLAGTQTPLTQGGVLDRQGENINLIWGVVVLIFGAGMLFFALRGKSV